MFVRVKDLDGKYMGVNVDKIMSISESLITDNCRDIALENGASLETKDDVDDLICLFNDPKNELKIGK